MVGVAGDGTLRVGVPSIGKHSLRGVVAGGGSHHAEVAEQDGVSKQKLNQPLDFEQVALPRACFL